MASTSTHFTTRWWRRAADDPSKVVCTLCPRECSIPAGSRGFCFVRANDGGELVLTTYGRSSGFCIDPIEKKPLNHFLPGTPILSLGTAGCNLGCKFCQNWDISKSREMDTLAGNAGPEAIVQAALDTGCRSIAFTYNDPTIWAEYAIDIAKVARPAGLRTVAVTAGYISPEPRVEFYQHMDAANVDLKAFTESFYRRLTQTHLQPVLDTLEYLCKHTNVWVEITTLLIPGENDEPDETKAMCDWIAAHLGPQVPLHFTAFHPDFKMRDKPRTPPETLARARELALARGLQYVYVGNVNDVARQSTYCHHCGELVIERDWYELGQYHLRGPTCAHCGATIPGVFDAAAAQPGVWGRKRQPVRISDPRQYVPLRVTTASGAAAAFTSPAREQGVAAQPQEPNRMEPRITAFSNTAAPPLDSALQAALLQSARAMLDEVIRTGSTDANAQVPADLQALAGWGMFVTLTRAGQLRACRGRWGDQLTLPQLLATVVTDTALHDQRFAAITAAELPRLDLDISLMHSPAALEGIGHSLAQQVRVGTHGLVITHPRGRGLLLPQVAVEQGWDAPTFLHQLCRKANLPADTWVTDEATHVLSFQVELLQDAAPQPDLDFQQLHDLRLHQLLTLAEAVLADQATSPPDPADAFLNEPRPGEELGVQLHTGNGLNGTALGAGHSLAQLTRMAAQSLRDLVRQQRQTAPTLARLDVLGQSLRLRAADFPQRHNLLALQAVLAQHEQGWELSLPDPHAPHLHRVQMALQAADIDPQHWRQAEEQGMSKPRLTAFNLHQHQREQYPGALAERAPARAGQFYPGKPEEMQREVERWLTLAPDDGTADSAPAAHRAIMLPHAGWMYCGKTLGRTLRQTQVPDTVIIIGPKHTNQGCNWSVPPHQRWRLPTGSVPIAVDLLEQLLRAIPGLRCDAAAHAMEHGVEVLLPFLQHVNPQVRVAPMALGHCNYDDTQTIARGLRQVLDAEVAAGKPAPLLLISSDMNHFAPDAEGRRLDRLALDAMLAGDPRQLYDTCLRHEISMCGMRPAVAILNALRLEPEHPLHLRLTHYSTSADASGDRSRVVGYAGVLVD